MSSPNPYTPEIIETVKKAISAKRLQRPDAVKYVRDYFKIGDRQGREVFVRYFEDNKQLFEPENKQKIIGRPIKRLFWDIESAPNIGLFWRSGFKLNIGPENIIKERAIICIGYKWSHEKEAHILYWDKDQNDRKMLAEFIRVLEQADEIVGHNLDRFDMPWAKTRCLFHNLPPIPDCRQIDTLKWARSKFYFNSNKLDYIAKFLGLGGKIKTEFGLWKDVLLNHCPKALNKMGKYCKYDVILLEKVWGKLSQLVPHKTHVGVLSGGEKWQNPRTGSTNVRVSKMRVTAGGVVQYQMISLDDRTYYTISERAHEIYLAAKKR